jgi:hypothetical protein
VVFLLACLYISSSSQYDTGLPKEKVNASICCYLFACLFLLALPSWLASMAVGIAAHAPSTRDTAR